LKVFKPDVLQTDAADLPLLRLPAQLELLPVLRGVRDESGDLPSRLLFEGPASGAGVPCDWTAARNVARRTELVLAGGLNPGNVAAAIVDVEPFGVDVSSGVEARPGVKSPVEIANFVSAVRDARPGSAGRSKLNLAVSQSGATAEQSRSGVREKPCA
ncbi:MAG: phosphoribosylanthranilate isomerase, partial [Steroidobacteraceae bacterium]